MPHNLADRVSKTLQRFTHRTPVQESVPSGGRQGAPGGIITTDTYGAASHIPVSHARGTGSIVLPAARAASPLAGAGAAGMASQQVAPQFLPGPAVVGDGAAKLSDIDQLGVNLREVGADGETIAFLRREFGLVATILKDVDTTIIIDRSGSTAGARAKSIEKCVEVIAAAARVFDKDGIKIRFVSELRPPPAHHVTTAAGVREAFARVPPSGGTPIAWTLHQEVEEYGGQLLQNEKVSADDRDAIKPSNIVVILDGGSSRDYNLEIGMATPDGVFIDGELAPEGALVAGLLPAPEALSDAQLVDNKIFDENGLPHPGIPVGRNAAEGIAFVEHTSGPMIGTLQRQDTREGVVLVRLPMQLEQVIVDAARMIKKLGHPSGQLGICFFQIGNDEGVEEELGKLDNLPDSPAYRGTGLRDVVSYVKPQANGSLSGNDIIWGLASARNQRLAKASATARSAVANYA